jgi:hypothetical protein
VVGGGVGWLAATLYVQMAGLNAGLVGTVVVGAVLFGLVVLVGFAPVERETLPRDAVSPYEAWNHRRSAKLLVWFTVSGLLTNVIVKAAFRGWYLSDSGSLTAIWLVALSLGLVCGCVGGLMFPRAWSVTLAWLPVALRHRPRLPTNLMRVLEDARERGVLDVEGAVYRLRIAAADAEGAEEPSV